MEVQDMRITSDLEKIFKQMLEGGGFVAKQLALGREILIEMLKSDCLKFLSFPACIVATGLRGLLAQAISRGYFDVIVTTCGTLDHDLARAWGGKYYHGSFDLDDHELNKAGINRLGNILIPNKSYGELIEKRMQPILEQLAEQKSDWSGRELIQEFGSRLSDENSILYQAAKRSIPIYVPGITDGAFGTNLVWFSQDHNFKLDLLKDERELADLAFSASRSGALIIGGGISKHHTLWWNQFKGGLDYAVYITTASEYDGSLSGARTKEAVSWGKIARNARYVTINAEASIILPILFGSIPRSLSEQAQSQA